MATYAEVRDNVVVNCIVADPAFIASLANGADFHPYDQSHPVGIGWTWDENANTFYAPQPFPSWTLDDHYRWQPPIPYPTDGGNYYWDEETGTWIVSQSEL